MNYNLNVYTHHGKIIHLFYRQQKADTAMISENTIKVLGYSFPKKESEKNTRELIL